MKKNTPILTFIPRTWMLLVFMVLANYACFSNHQITKAKWIHSDEKAWVQIADGTWQQTIDGGWSLEPGKTLFDYFGSMIYVPAVASVVLVLALLVRHLFFRQTIDAYIHSGGYLKDWEEIPGFYKILISNAVLLGLGFIFAIVANGVAK